MGRGGEEKKKKVRKNSRSRKSEKKEGGEVLYGAGADFPLHPMEDPTVEELNISQRNCGLWSDQTIADFS